MLNVTYCFIKIHISCETIIFSTSNIISNQACFVPYISIWHRGLHVEVVSHLEKNCLHETTDYAMDIEFVNILLHCSRRSEMKI